ncbi:MAG TPA: hypothetical protein VGW75_00650 [Solirubrobacteraceae bacterium]|jgi:hypothetical protein|nr:hypothetical protein [Solirubrobacteraceae bacterium]
MSEIPFVHRLGDAIDDAISAPERARRRRRRRPRYGGLAVAILLLGAAGVTAAAILDDPETLAVNAIGCYDGTSLDANTTVLSADGRPPTDVCREVLGSGDAPLAACSNGEAVAVFRGDRRTCERLGLKPLPPGFAPARAKVAALSTRLRAIERRGDCIEPERMAREARAVLERSRWRGWRVVVRGGDGGPCAWIHLPGGGTATRLSGSLDVDRRRLAVSTGPPRSLFRRLYGEGAAAGRLLDASTERCLTIAGLRRAARRELARTRRSVGFRLEAGPMPPSEGLEPPERQRRFEEGCAVFAGLAPVYPRSRRIAIEVEIRVKRAY